MNTKGIISRKLLLSILIGCSCAWAEAPVVPAAQAMRFPHVGITLTAPAGFTCQSVSDKFVVMRADLYEQEKSVLRIFVRAVPAEPGISADDLNSTALTQLKSRTEIEDVQSLVEPRPMDVAGLAGVAGRVKYNLNGQEFAAVNVCFIRDLNGGSGIRIAYLLTVVSDGATEVHLLPTLSKVIKSIRLIPVQHPRSSGIQLLSDPLVDQRFGYSVQIPRGWFVSQTPTGMTMGQADYLSGCRKGISAEIIAREIPAGTKISNVIDQRIETHRQNGFENKTMEVLSQEPAKLSGLEAKRVVLTERADEPTTVPAQANASELDKIVSVHLFAPSQAGESGPTRLFELTGTFINVEPKQAAKMLQQIADGFKIDPIPEPTSIIVPAKK